MFRRIWHFLQRRRAYRRLDSHTPKKTIDDIIEEYIDAGHYDMVALADALCLTPIELYTSAKRQAPNVRVRLSAEYRNEIERLRRSKYGHLC